jgi:hypothetical protein
MRLALLGSILVWAFGCGDSEPADVAGSYSLSLTNRENGCGFDNWMEGNTASNIPLELMQNGSDVTGEVGGGAGLVLDIVLGSRTYIGEVHGSSIDMDIFGTNSLSEGNCSYTYNSSVHANLDGDVLTGSIEYRAATNGNPDCSALEGCVSQQDFNGTRPPQ